MLPNFRGFERLSKLEVGLAQNLIVVTQRIAKVQKPLKFGNTFCPLKVMTSAVMMKRLSMRDHSI